jgi:hypothetical protein
MGKVPSRIGSLLCVFLLAAGCAPGPAARTPETTARAAELRLESLHCQEVPGLEPLLAPGTALLLGEMHGTAESPAFAGNAVCLALRKGTAVTLGLEIPREEGARLEAFLSSPGTEKDQAALFDSPFWQSDYQDGRRSQSRFALLDQMRRWRLQGWPVHVVLFDRSAQPTGADEERDRWMAEGMKDAIEARPGDLFLALAGDVHMRIRRGTPWNPDYQPAGFVLTQFEPQLKVTALNLAYSGGNAWFCVTAEPPSCKVRSLRGAGDDQGVRVIQYPEVKDGYTGAYNVGLLTASFPAARSADELPGRQSD